MPPVSCSDCYQNDSETSHRYLAAGTEKVAEKSWLRNQSSRFLTTIFDVEVRLTFQAMEVLSRHDNLLFGRCTHDEFTLLQTPGLQPGRAELPYARWIVEALSSVIMASHDTGNEIRHDQKAPIDSVVQAGKSEPSGVPQTHRPDVDLNGGKR